ncbi:hypothetical protein OROMI_024290 [Orobanche minor]
MALADPKEARAGIQEIHFLPFNPTDKRTALTYLDGDGKMHRVSKGAPEQILHLAHNKSDIELRVHAVIDKFAERGLRSLAVAIQLDFMLLALIWEFDFPPFMVLIIAIFWDKLLPSRILSFCSCYGSLIINDLSAGKP